jgi:hypothetical protein
MMKAQLKIRRLRSSERHTCEVQPCVESPSGCSKRASHELKMLGGVSWVCSAHLDLVTSKLSGGAPASIWPDPGPGSN